MAEFKGANAAKRTAEPQQKLDVRDQGGRYRVARDRYTLDGTEVATDTIVMGVLPKGAKPYDMLISSPVTTGLTDIDVGHSASADGSVSAVADAFKSSASLAAAAVERLDAGDIAAGVYGDKIDEEVNIVMTVNAGTAAAASTIDLVIYYTID